MQVHHCTNDITIGYACDPGCRAGEDASDDVQSGLYTSSLLRYMMQPLALHDMLIKAHKRTQRKSRRCPCTHVRQAVQHPWFETQTKRHFTLAWNADEPRSPDSDDSGSEEKPGDEDNASDHDSDSSESIVQRLPYCPSAGANLTVLFRGRRQHMICHALAVSFCLLLPNSIAAMTLQACSALPRCWTRVCAAAGLPCQGFAPDSSAVPKDSVQSRW